MFDEPSSIDTSKSLPSSLNPLLLFLPSLTLIPPQTLTLTLAPPRALPQLPLAIPNPINPSFSLALHHCPLPPSLLSPPPFSSSSGDRQPYGQEVVEKRIKVYWPLDKACYEGRVKSFDNITGQLLVRYDDDEEEPLDIAKEKIEWVQDTAKKLKRLSHGFSASKMMVIEDDEEAVNEDIKVEESRGGAGCGSCEDCRKNKVVEEAEDDEEYMKLENEEDEEDTADEPQRKGSGKVEPRKRKVGGVEKLGPAKSKSK